jgi:hypothetical protein
MSLLHAAPWSDSHVEYKDLEARVDALREAHLSILKFVTLCLIIIALAHDSLSDAELPKFTNPKLTTTLYKCKNPSLN